VWYSEDQIEIAFSRHATSKISEFNDLDRITSYGFRGEALPSIASVSQLRMVSRAKESEVGTEIVYEGGVLHSKQPAASPPGTTIEVDNLFFNTPARRKFLKAESTEARHISRIAMALALGRYDIGFSYQLNGRRVFSMPPGQTLGERVTALLAPGKKFIDVSGEMGLVKVEGFVGLPDMAQKNRNSQFIFINGRSIQSPQLAHAFALGYGELLPRGNFPIGALLLTLDPAEVDVNVHPAKTEVRLSRDREVHDTLYRLIKEGLRQDGLMPTLKVPDQTHSTTEASNNNSLREWPSHKIPGMAQRAGGNTEFLDEIYKGVRPVTGDFPSEVVRVDAATGEILEKEQVAQTSAARDDKPSGSLRLIGRFDNLYLLFQVGDELLVVDQHTAHERVLYEEMLKKMDNQGGTAQQLLLPVQVEFSPEQMIVFEEAQEGLQHSGFGAAPFGGCTVRIEAVPSILSKKSPEKALRTVIDDIASLRKAGFDLTKAIAQSVACRSAVMAGDRLSDREAVGLVEQLRKCENMYSCPHGRPTFIKLTRTDLDKQFGRG